MWIFFKLDTLQGFKKQVFQFFIYVVELSFLFKNFFATQLLLHLIIFNFTFTQKIWLFYLNII